MFKQETLWNMEAARNIASVLTTVFAIPVLTLCLYCKPAILMDIHQDVIVMALTLATILAVASVKNLLHARFVNMSQLNDMSWFEQMCLTALCGISLMTYVTLAVRLYEVHRYFPMILNVVYTLPIVWLVCHIFIDMAKKLAHKC